MKRVLLIATGGTIASKRTNDGLIPGLEPAELLERVPRAKEFCEVDSLSPMTIDSTNIMPSHWKILAGIIEENYQSYDGFVICHGTDTMAYTAAALSYLVQGTCKPIVLTGSQKPIDMEDTDARQNLLDSLLYAASGKGGVCIIFDGHVIAGTRAHKTRSKSYNAFSSINFPDLASIRDGRVVRYIPFAGEDNPRFYKNLSERVMLLKLIPGMPKGALLSAGELCDGLIIESYGVGGIPDLYLGELEELLSKGKHVVMATQATEEGSELSAYQVGHRLMRHYGVLESHDMTLESTVTKLMWALGQSGDFDRVRELFLTPVNYDLLF